MWTLPSNIREKLVAENHLYLKNSEPITAEIKKLFDLAYDFFMLPLEEKEKFAAGNLLTGLKKQPRHNYVKSGLMGTFFYKPADKIDFPNDNSIFTAFFNQVCYLHKELDSLSSSILKSIGESYSKDSQKIETNLNTWLQVNCDNPAPSERELLQDEHENCNLITIATSTGKGFEFKAKDSTYKQGDYGVDKLVVIPGSLISLLTNGDIKPLPHRLRNYQDYSERLSIVYFVNPNSGQQLQTWVNNGKLFI